MAGPVPGAAPAAGWKSWNWATQTWVPYAGLYTPATLAGSNWQVTAGLPGTWPLGYYAVQAQAIDRLSNTATSAPVYFNIGDNTTPTVSITYPANNGWYLYPGINRIAGTADDGGGSGIDRVMCQLSWYDAGAWKAWDWATQTWVPWTVALWTTASLTGTNWEVTAGLPDPRPLGACAVQAQAFDRVGKSQYTPWIYFTVGDNVPPSGTITCPEPYATYFPGLPRIAGTAHNGQSGVNRVECFMRGYDSTSGTWKAWNWVTHAWEEGSPAGGRKVATGKEDWEINSDLPEQWSYSQSYSYYAGAIVYDNAGNATGLQAVYFRVYESVPPTVEITYPEEGESYFPGPERLGGTASDAGSGLREVVVSYLAWYDLVASRWEYWDWVAHAWVTEYSANCRKTATGTENWEVTTDLPAPWPCQGSYQVGAVAYDNCGNGAFAWVGFAVWESVPPQVAITYPEPDVWYYPGLERIAGVASDVGSGVKEVVCYLVWFDEANGAYKHWNWVTHTWETVYSEDWYQTANGTETWEVTSDLPTSWPCCQSYTAGAIAYDACGNLAGDYVEFNVGDRVPPEISTVSASPNVLWPPNHKMVKVQVFVHATDNCDPAPVSKITGVTCNEPAHGRGDGNTDFDWEITGDLTLNLRAERAGSSTSRIYTINVVCTDRCGNSTQGSVQVTVPHDQGH